MKKHVYLIDGQPMTIDEIADMIGMGASTLRARKCNMGCGYQTIVTLWREGRLTRRGDLAPRHMVNGRWITIQQAADERGIRTDSINHWRWITKKRTGRTPTLAEAYEHFGHNNHNGGRKPKRYNVNGKRMTVLDAAVAYGMVRTSIYNYMSKHKCGLAEAIRNMQANKETAAAWKIMAVLREGENRG